MATAVSKRRPGDRQDGKDLRPDTVAPAPLGPLGWVDRAFGWFSFSLSALASSTIAFTMLLICADVAMRSFFSVPINGVSDFVAYSIVSCVFVQLGSTVRTGKLINAEFLMQDWVVRKPILAAGANLVYFVVGSLILWAALVWLWNDFTRSYANGDYTGAVGAYQITLWPFKLAVAVGCAVAMVETVRQAGFHLVSLARALGAGHWRGSGASGLCVFLGIITTVLLILAFGGLSPITVGLLAFAGLFALVACGMPVAFALIAMSFIGIWLSRGNMRIAENALGISASGSIKSFEFGVVPLFVMMGLVLDRADVGRDAFQVAVVLLRRVRGGLGIATVAANAVFAAITGSSIASAAVFSRIAVPPMVEAGHTRRFAVGVVAGSSVLGMLIPPSLLLIVYGLIAETSIGNLFIAAILPGLLLAFAFGLLNVCLATFTPDFVGTVHKIDTEKMSLAQMVTRLTPVLCLILLVMGGIYGGVFSPTEAGAVGAFGAFLVAAAKRKLTFDALKTIVLETGYITASILFLIIAASLYARMLALSTIPMQMTAFIGSMDLSLIPFMLAYFVLVVLLGMILDSVSIMLIILPIALPVVTALGGDLVWFGIVSVIAIEIGLLTPPFGLSVYVVKGSLPDGFVTLGEIFTGAAPFVITMVIVTMILIFFPIITLALL